MKRLITPRANYSGCRRYTLIFAILLASWTHSSTAYPGGPSPKSQVNENEIQVSLLSQPCVLKGPFDKSTLKTIHAFGPAQMIPEIIPSRLAESRDRFQKSLEKLNNTHGVPTQLDRYLEKLRRRLEAQTEILKALLRYKDSKNPVDILNICKKYLNDKTFRTIEAFINKLSYHRVLSTDQIEDFLTIYNNNIEPDPEQDFHRITTDKLHVQYSCSFDENEEQ